MARFILMFIGLAVFLLAQPALASPEAAVSQTTFKAWSNENDNPTTPGYHKLVYTWKEGGRDRRMPFMLYLPQGYDASKKWPLLVFLSGMGERGSDPSAVMNCGIPADLSNRPEVLKWLPMMMIFPLCPGDRTWEMEDMPTVVVSLIRSSMVRWPVDSKRVYLTGLSMGGRGCWALAREAPDLFAVTAPIAAHEFEPEITAKALAGSDTTVLVISGMLDEKSEPDSGHMVEALRKYSSDTVYVPIPNARHFIWAQYYRSKDFYQWLLLHEKGKPRPVGRASADDLIGLFFADQKGGQAFQDKLQKEFSTFAQYWFVDNCAPQENDVGLKAKVAGKNNVFVTYPLAREVACRLQTTRTIPPNKQTLLKIVAGRHPEGDWELVVRVDELEVLRTPVDKKTAPDGWLEAQCDLTPFAAGEVRIQIAQQATGSRHSEAYWAQVELESK